MDYYKIYDFMKSYRQWSMFEIDYMRPIDLEVFYYMAVKAYKEEHGVK